MTRHLRTVRAQLARLDEFQGDIARRNARREVRAVVRRLLAAMDRLFPAPKATKKKSRKRQPSEWAQQVVAGAFHAKRIAAAGVRVTIGNPGMWVPSWAYVMSKYGDNVETIRKAKRDIGLRREKLALHALSTTNAP